MNPVPLHIRVWLLQSPSIRRAHTERSRAHALERASLLIWAADSEMMRAQQWCSEETFRGLFFFFFPCFNVRTWNGPESLFGGMDALGSGFPLWKVLLLLLILLQSGRSSLLDCHPSCSCTSSEILCNRPDSSKQFPMPSFHGPSGAGNLSVGEEDLLENITSMWVHRRDNISQQPPKLKRMGLFSFTLNPFSVTSLIDSLIDPNQIVFQLETWSRVCEALKENCSHTI